MCKNENVNSYFINLSDKNYKLYNPDITVFSNDTVEFTVNVFSDKRKTVPKNISGCTINVYAERNMNGKITNIEQIEDAEYVTRIDDINGQFKLILKKSIVQFESELAIQIKLIQDDNIVSLEPFLIFVENGYVGSAVMSLATDDIYTLELLHKQLKEYSEELIKVTQIVEYHKGRLEEGKHAIDVFIQNGNKRVDEILFATKKKLETLNNDIKGISDDYKQHAIRPIYLKQKDVMGSNLIYFETDVITDLKDLLKSGYQISVGGYTATGVFQQALGMVIFNANQNTGTIKVYYSVLIDKSVSGKLVHPDVMFSNISNTIDINNENTSIVVKTNLSKGNVENLKEAFCVLTPIANFK